MEGDNPGPWAYWLGGKWTRRKPTKPGLYPIASLDGTVRDPRSWLIIEDDGRERGRGFAEPGWQGWVWDRPMPPILRPPMELVEDKQLKLPF